MCMIYRLIEKKLSKIFREPVDPVALPDYYEKIRKPIDLSTMIKKLKEGKYKFAVEVRDALNKDIGKSLLIDQGKRIVTL